jgi:hypothetical protein
VIPPPTVAGSSIKGKVMRSIIFGSLLAFSIILNIGTVTVSSVATTVSGLFESVTGMGTVLGAAGEGLSLAQARLATKEADLKTKEGHLKTAEAKIVDLTGELDCAKATNTQLDGDLNAARKKNAELLQEVAVFRKAQIVKYRGKKYFLQYAVSDTSSRISKRTATGASRNLAATFGEAWPVAGTAVIVTATTLELYDACVIMQDLHELDVAFNPNADFGAAKEVCGLRVPSADEIWAKVTSSPGEAWAKAKAAMPDLPEMPDIPGLWDAIWSVDWELRNPLEGYELRLPGQ